MRAMVATVIAAWALWWTHHGRKRADRKRALPKYPMSLICVTCGETEILRCVVERLHKGKWDSGTCDKCLVCGSGWNYVWESGEP